MLSDASIGFGVAEIRAAHEFREIQRRQLGGAMRRRRHARDLTLAQLSARAGVSVSMLSQVERGLLDPSLDSLRNIADALGTSPFRLLEEDGTVSGIVRRGSGRTIVTEDGGFRFELLSPSLEGAFEIAVWELKPGHSSTSQPRAHPGEEANLFLQGWARLEIGEETMELRAGDCITFDPSRPHRVTALGDEVVICVDVISPPTF